MAPVIPEPREGYWGKPTATLEWCEENYIDSYYIAEMWNTLSNLGFILFSFAGIYFARRDKVETRYVVSFLGMIFIGLGSTAFHMTMRLDMQLWDELAMVWCTAIFAYSMFECNKGGHGNAALVAFLVCYCLSVTVAYVILLQPVFHQAAFGLMTVVVIFRAIHLMRHIEHSKFLFFYPLLLYIAALILWSIDNNFCPSVRSVRASLPFPVSIVTQLHAWWHMLIATASQGQIMFSCYSRNAFLKRKCFVWNWCGFLPFVTVADDGTRQANGEGKVRGQHGRSKNQSRASAANGKTD